MVDKDSSSVYYMLTFFVLGGSMASNLPLLFEMLHGHRLSFDLEEYKILSQCLLLGVVVSAPLIIDLLINWSTIEGKIHRKIRFLLLLLLCSANSIMWLCLNYSSLLALHKEIYIITQSAYSVGVQSVILYYFALTGGNISVLPIGLLINRFLSMLHVIHSDNGILYELYLFSLYVSALLSLDSILDLLFLKNMQLTKFDQLYIGVPVLWFIVQISSSYYFSNTFRLGQQSIMSLNISNLLNASFTLVIVLVSGSLARQESVIKLESTKSSAEVEAIQKQLKEYEEQLKLLSQQKNPVTVASSGNKNVWNTLSETPVVKINSYKTQSSNGSNNNGSTSTKVQVFEPVKVSSPVDSGSTECDDDNSTIATKPKFEAKAKTISVFPVIESVKPNKVESRSLSPQRSSAFHSTTSSHPLVNSRAPMPPSSNAIPASSTKSSQLSLSPPPPPPRTRTPPPPITPRPNTTQPSQSDREVKSSPPRVQKTTAQLVIEVKERAITPPRRQHHIEGSERIVTPVNSPKEEYVRSLTVVNLMKEMVQHVVVSSPERRQSFTADQLNPKPLQSKKAVLSVHSNKNNSDSSSGPAFTPLLHQHSMDVVDEVAQLEHQAKVSEELRAKKEQIRLRRAAAQAAIASGKK